MVKNISIVGSTGSIGVQTLDVVRRFPGRFKVVGLSAHSDWETLYEQVQEFKPLEASVADAGAAGRLSEALGGSHVKVWTGETGSARIASIPEAHTTLISVVGMAGLLPSLAAIDGGKTIALATKEVLVAGGDIVMKRAKERNVSIIPVDSEHSAIFQCMGNNRTEWISRILLTSSGGPFRGYTIERLKEVTREAALAHPTWNMGKKITIDSATLMNKGFEVLEAHHLFSLPIEKIEVVVHPQSIIHSLVEYTDGSTLAQLSPPDMRLPIQYALTYPERVSHSWKTLSLAEIGMLTFQNPDTSVFRCLELACQAGKTGKTMPCVLNAANEIAVDCFLKKQISFLQISSLIQEVMEAHEVIHEPDIPDIIEADRWARKKALDIVKKIR